MLHALQEGSWGQYINYEMSWPSFFMYSLTFWVRETNVLISVDLPIISSLDSTPHGHIDLVHPPCSRLFQNTLVSCFQFQHNCGQYVFIYFAWSHDINLFLSSPLTICHCLSFALYNSCGCHDYASSESTYSILFAWSPPVTSCGRLDIVALLHMYRCWYKWILLLAVCTFWLIPREKFASHYYAFGYKRLDLYIYFCHNI
jgi:hypothetical protein